MTQVTSMKAKPYSTDNWISFRGLRFGTRVLFGSNLEGEVIEAKFVGPDATQAYLVEWWDNEGNVRQVELYEAQLRVVEK